MRVPLILVALYAVKGGSTVGHIYLMEFVGQRIMADLRIDLYGHLQRLSLGYYDKSSTGELMSRITNDVNLIQGSVSNLITGAIKEILTIISLVAVVIYMDWFLSIFALLVFPICVIPLMKFGRRLRKISKGTQESMADLSVFLNETLRGATVVKGFCRRNTRPPASRWRWSAFLGCGSSIPWCGPSTTRSWSFWPPSAWAAPSCMRGTGCSRAA